MIVLPFLQLLIGDPAPAIDRVAWQSPVTIVDFFATWCGPCHEAMQALDAIARADPQVQLVVVDVGEPPETVNAFFASHPLPANARLVFDRSASLSRAWGQRRFPTTFVLDDKGVVRKINRGYGPGYAARLRAWVRALHP